MTPHEDVRAEVRLARARLAYAPFDFLAPPCWRAIVKLAALKHGVGRRDVLSPDRSRKVVAARYQAMRLIGTHCNFSAPAIGRLMDRDRTTVLYAIGRAPSHDRKLKRPRYAH